MRFAPTSALIACAVIGCIVGACADTTESAPPPEETPPSHHASGTTTSTSDNDPTFDADFGDAGTKKAADAAPPPPPKTCPDKDDPGSTLNAAKALPDTDDCDRNSKTFSGVISTAADVDMYKLSGKDKPICSLATEFEVQDGGVELCVYVRCKDGSRDPFRGCKQGSAADPNELGLSGCCTNGGSQAAPDWDCSGFTDDDSADFYLRVKSADGNQCVPYDIRYRF